MIELIDYQQDRLNVARLAVNSSVAELLKLKSYESHEKYNEISKLESDIFTCNNCFGFNIQEKTMSTPGYGSYNANLFILGQSLHSYDPIAKERQVPFIFLALETSYGVKLFQAFGKLGFTFKENMFVTNVVKCHPANNRPSKKLEVCNCANFLNREIDIIKPSIYLLLGNDATKRLSVPSKKQSYTSVRGKYISAYHPSYINRYAPALMEKYINEICNRIKTLMENNK